VHSPEICYSSQGFQPAKQAERLPVHPSKDASHEFWQVTLKSAGPTPSELQVAFGWNAGHGWVAPDYPRFAFGGRPFLYKMQMATSSAESGDSNGFQGFLDDFLPVLDASLFPTSG
jgi:hypothetical protein